MFRGNPVKHETLICMENLLSRRSNFQLKLKHPFVLNGKSQSKVKLNEKVVVY